jgi:hypothetical protein
MLVSEISQLTENSIRFLIDRLKLSKTDEESSADFKLKIEKAVAIKRRKIDSVAHNLMDQWKKGKKNEKKKSAEIPVAENNNQPEEKEELP